MLTGLLLALIGAADLLRTHLGRPWAIVSGVAVWSAAVVAAGAGLGAPVPGLVAAVALAVGWLLTTTTVEGARPPGGLRPAVGLVVAVLVLGVADRAAGPATGPLADGYAALSRAESLPPIEQAVLALGSALLLLESGNVIVRAALFRELPQPVPTRPRLSLRDRLLRSSPVEEVRLPDLRGGRAIGQLERLLVAGLTLSGAIGLAGAVFAAKGIVRFPEISRDEEGGARAEYFLVGSLVSWALALGCTALVALAGV